VRRSLAALHREAQCIAERTALAWSNHLNWPYPQGSGLPTLG
jgi:hypothetical protein